MHILNMTGKAHGQITAGFYTNIQLQFMHILIFPSDCL